MHCPLCQATGEIFFKKKIVHYFQCKQCELTFLDSQFFLTPEVEKERYSHHNNDLAIAGYRNFLTQAFSPILPYLKPGMIGLDYGSGPVPNGEILLRELGHHCKSFDLHFTGNEALAPNSYDYLILCEVIEHFKDLKNDLSLALNFLKPQGYLYIHTAFLKDNESFPQWYYHHDQTHVIFFKEKTFLSLREIFDLELISISMNSVILKKR